MIWSNEEKSFLQKLIENHSLSTKDMCNLFRNKFPNRSKSSIKGAIHRKIYDANENENFKISGNKCKTSRRIWTNEEIGFLKKLYESDGLSLSELFVIFNNLYKRSLESIANKITKLKLKHSKEQLRNIKSRLNIGHKNGMYGKSSPNKGKNKYTCKSIEISSKKISITRKEMYKNGELNDMSGKNNPMYGVKSWNNGLNKYNNEIINLYSKKISEIKKEWWNKQTDENKNIILQRLNEARLKTKKNTRIEQKIENFLIFNNIKYLTQYRIDGFYADFYLPDYCLVIECDGDYWHGNPMFYNLKNLTNVQLKNIERDKRKKLTYNKKNINSLFLWENDIIYFFDKIEKIIFKSLLTKV